ncbi:YpdA family putative bacillithiol disulfide reductase [Cohnella rhizosphaerae]|uniref:YpdA family putative bacillithiol disulfide reductase n=1 Tax=Cohnella rhizosphaerae TaxID=1457232 RepID=A0A9X4QUR0_9BACL|nr:YpdA family putative bacillithiol disulfide reductase [Cohnella rhizosphaerae]MDG0811769.1 YpdA family putative bacillithiol disulfide reductase [Cohnella rhizosphaerae]
MEDIVIVGAGPCGLSAAAELQDQGFNPLLFEKENVGYSISRYPVNMQFFSTAPNLEIAGIPFITPNDKPSRLEALNYYRIVSERRGLRIRRYEAVTAVEKEGDAFRVTSVGRSGQPSYTHARKVVIATGYFDHPNRIGIPGENHAHVSHFFTEAHPYAGTRVVVIGGSNSAVDAALEMERVGAKVTVVYRGESVSANIKPWVRPIFDSCAAKGRIDLRLRSSVVEIGYDQVTVERVQEADSADGRTEVVRETLPADFVLALTGFRPDRAFLRSMGIDAPDGIIPPKHDPETMETNVPGLYLAGVVSTGRDANEIFIESGRYHGRKIAAHLAAQRTV